MSNFAATVDARIYEPKDKHPIIFKTFENLGSGEKMELPEQFEWEYLEEGPEAWRVSITKK